MDLLFDFLSRLFTAEQSGALIISAISVSLMTQAFKNIYFGFWPVKSPAVKNALIWSFSISAGALTGVVGYFISIPPQPLWFWLFAGIASGGVAIILYDLVLARLPRKPVTAAGEEND